MSVRCPCVQRLALILTAARAHSRFGSARDPRGQPLRQLLLVTSCDSPAGIGASLQTHYGLTDGLTDGQTDVTLEIVF